MGICVADVAQVVEASTGICCAIPRSMAGGLLKGIRVLVVTNHMDFAGMFAAMVSVCGGEPSCVRSSAEAVDALMTGPHVMVLDTELPDELRAVPTRAASLNVPIVAFAFRNEDPWHLPAALRSFGPRLVTSTDLYEVCSVRRAAAGTVS